MSDRIAAPRIAENTYSEPLHPMSDEVRNATRRSDTPVSPIATQETDYPAIWLEPKCNGDSREWCSADMWDECEECGTPATRYVRGDQHDAAVEALSSAERRIEELVRGLAGRTRALTYAVVSRDERIAALTGQVEDMRERAAKVAGLWLCRNCGAHFDTEDGCSCSHPDWDRPLTAEEIQAAIRSLPVLPTTGDGGGWRSMDSAPKDGTQVMIFCPSYYQGKGGVSWGVFVGGRWMDSRAFATEPTHWMPLPSAPTGRETSGEET